MKPKLNSHIKILLVDDLPENLFALELILSNKNYLCVKANSGNEALKILLHEQDFAIILMDVQMPEMDGFETVELIREIEILKHVPIIFLTASMDNSVHIFKGYQAGAVDYMIKPLNPELLKAKVGFFVELHLKTLELLVQNGEKEKRAEELTIAITELKYAQDDIRKLNDELEQKVAERTAQLEYVNKELGSFSYSVSHDLRAPIRAINGYTSILMEDYAEKFDSDGTKVLNSIIHNSKKMGLLIDDLLAFSKLGRKQVTVSEINMTAQVNLIREELLFDEGENIPEFNVNALPRAKGDPSLIKQVWINLISNAIKYSKYKPKTTIEIGAYEKDNLVVYYVKDEGAGFDMQYYDKLFGVFQRLHSQEEFEGTGIGLAIVEKIVNRHSGSVWAESKLNEGSCFYFSLPNFNL